MERRKFTRKFKLEAVRLIRDRGVSYVHASQDLNVHTSQLSAALFDKQMRPSSRKRVKADQRLSMYSMALATSLRREGLARCSRIQLSRSATDGALSSCRTTRRCLALWPLIEHSISNRASMPRTASRANGEIAAGVLPCALSQAISCRANIGAPDRQPDPYARGARNHRRSNTSSTRRNARRSKPLPTQIRYFPADGGAATPACSTVITTGISREVDGSDGTGGASR